MVSEQLMVIVIKAWVASSEMNTLVSLAFLSNIFIRGSRYVSMHLFRNWNMSRIVIRACLERLDLNESASFVSCFTRL